MAVIVLATGALTLSHGGPRAARASDPGDPVVMAAGDIADCATTYDEATAEVVKHQITADPSTTVAMLGDGAYPKGDLATYQQCYAPSWGAFKAPNTRPTPGNHDYAVGPGRKSAPGYFAYFGSAAADPNQGFYSYDLGAWHIVSLNSTCAVPGAGCGPSAPQVQWLQSDLAAHPSQCILAYWHHPRFFSLQKAAQPGATGPSFDTSMSNIWDILQAHGADVVLNGHVHLFETFPRQDSAGNLTADGMREFVVGTGGGPPDTFDPNHIDPHSQSRHDHVFGMLKMTLHPDGYDWAFLTTGGDPAGTVLESGHDTCSPASVPPTTTTTNSAPGPGTTPTTPSATPPASRSGYWMVGADGRVYAFGDAMALGDALRGADAVDLEPTPSGKGYWILDSAGTVSNFGDARWLGNSDQTRFAPGEQVTSLSSTRSGGGYWIFTNRGRALPFGDAMFYGDMSAVRLNGPVLDSIPSASGNGYYMVASDGGIFTFGDARFAGSMGDKRLNAPVQSLVPNARGDGYWLVASDGGIFAFQAPFRGSMGNARLNQPITGMVRFGNGYLMAASDGGIFNFSDKAFYGSLGDNPPDQPIVSVAAMDAP